MQGDSNDLGKQPQKKDLTITDPSRDYAAVYIAGRDRLRVVLTSEERSDQLSSTPLEASISWALACRSAQDGLLKFTDTSLVLRIKCESLEAGRFFVGADDTKYDAQKLFYNVIYFVEEPPGTDTHPHADIFFRTKNDDVVLIDVSGSFVKDEIKKMRDKLRAWIQQPEQQNQTVFFFHGVVLAPFVHGESTFEHGKSTTDGTVTVVWRGRFAASRRTTATRPMARHLNRLLSFLLTSLGRLLLPAPLAPFFLSRRLLLPLFLSLLVGPPR